LISFELPRASNASAVRRALLSEVDDVLARGGIAAAIVEVLPLSESALSIFIRQERAGVPIALPLQPVTPSFFEISGVRIVGGRVANPRATPAEIVVSQAAARQLWPDRDPIGQTLHEGSNSERLTPVVVVGVASDAAIHRLAETTPVVYSPTNYEIGHVLTRDASTATLDRIRAAATALAPGTLVTSRPLTDQARASLQRALIGSWLAWAIGVLGLLLATVGAVGVFAYAVEERRREIGIRLALGARPAQVIAVVLRTSQTAALVGVAAGLALAIALAPLLRSRLYGLSPFDPQSYAQIGAILLAAAAVASWVPARRAVRINPVETLRTD